MNNDQQTFMTYFFLARPFSQTECENVLKYLLPFPVQCGQHTEKNKNNYRVAKFTQLAVVNRLEKVGFPFIFKFIITRFLLKKNVGIPQFNEK